MSWFDRVSWAPLAGYLVGVGLLVAYLFRDDGALLTAGVFIVVVSLVLGRLRELIAGPFKAKLFRDVAKAIAEEASADRPVEVSAPEPNVELQGTSAGQSSVSGSLTSSGSFTADAVIVRPDDIASANTSEELARRLWDYIRQEEGRAAPEGFPRHRGLSPSRIRAEQDLFGAILELQTDRERSGDSGTRDGYETAIQMELERWWAKPESLDDEEVVDLARRTRDLIGWRMKRGGEPNPDRS